MHKLFEVIAVGLAAFALVAIAFVANSVRLALKFNNESALAALAMTDDPADYLDNLVTVRQEALGLAHAGLSGIQVSKLMRAIAIAGSENPVSCGQSGATAREATRAGRIG